MGDMEDAKMKRWMSGLKEMGMQEGCDKDSETEQCKMIRFQMSCLMREDRDEDERCKKSMMDQDKKEDEEMMQEMKKKMEGMKEYCEKEGSQEDVHGSHGKE